VSSSQDYEKQASSWYEGSRGWHAFNRLPQVIKKEAYRRSRNQAFYRNVANEILAMVDALFPEGSMTPIVFYGDGKFQSGGYGKPSGCPQRLATELGKSFLVTL
jgi:hypothetical protein